MEKIENQSAIFRDIYKGDVMNLESAISGMKGKGISLRDSVVIIARELKMSLNDADLIVVNSVAWSDKKEQTEELRLKIHQILSNI